MRRDMNLEYEVIYSERKTIRISVERNRSVVVRAPYGASERKIREAVELKKLWLYEKINHPQKYNRDSQERKFIAGTSLLYLGKEYQLDATRKKLDGVKFDDKFILSKSSLPFAAELLRDWYFEEAKLKIIPKVRYYSRLLGVQHNEILISDLKYRWGSCTPKNNLNFNWRLIKAPMSVIEYVIVHELAHLLEPNHTTRFWSIVKAQIPYYQKAKDWLKEYGGLLEEKV
jgi:predicted metal-dependent hydrolase